MAIAPKILNTKNTVYGTKSLAQSEWRRLVGKALGPFWSGDYKIRGVKDLFEVGKYRDAIRVAQKLLEHITSVEALETMNEAELAAFYYLGLSYAQIGETEKAIACLHIVLSQNRFVSFLLIGFSHFIDASYYELKKFAKRYGGDYVNGIDPVRFLHRKKSSD